MKLRESGGCAVFVYVLTSPTSESMHDRVINSLLQFMYDNHSLNVFMSVGLIPSLVAFVEKHLQNVEEKQVIFQYYLDIIKFIFFLKMMQYFAFNFRQVGIILLDFFFNFKHTI